MLVNNTNFRFLSDIINQVIHFICRVDYNGVLGERHDKVRYHSIFECASRYEFDAYHLDRQRRLR